MTVSFAFIVPEAEVGCGAGLAASVERGSAAGPRLKGKRNNRGVTKSLDVITPFLIVEPQTFIQLKKDDCLRLFLLTQAPPYFINP